MALDRSHLMMVMFVLFGVAVVVALVAMLRWEHREFARRGLGRSWLVVRLAAIPITLVSLAALFVPARSVSGMEGLAVFYGMLFTAVPLLWFGLHWQVGRLVRPALAFGDSLQLAVMLPAFAIAATIVAHQLQPFAWAVARSAESAGYAMAEDAPPAHQLASATRYASPAGDVVTAHWRAAPDVVVERIDLVDGANVIRDAGRNSLWSLCQAPGTIVVLRTATQPAPVLHVYWRAGAGRLQRSTLTAPTPTDAVPFAVEWQGENGFALPEPLPRQTVWLAGMRDGRLADFGSSEAQQYQPGERIEMNCLPEGWQSQHPVGGVRVRVENPANQPVWLEAVRADPPEKSDQSS